MKIFTRQYHLSNLCFTKVTLNRCERISEVPSGIIIFSHMLLLSVLCKFKSYHDSQAQFCFFVNEMTYLPTFTVIYNE